jgi:hypothetical protein
LVIDIQDVRLDLLAIASATDCPLRAALAYRTTSTERRRARSKPLGVKGRVLGRVQKRSATSPQFLGIAACAIARLPCGLRASDPRSSLFRRQVLE